MKAKRRRHENAFKARVALEALKERKTIHEIAKENDVHPAQIAEWKKTLSQNIVAAFESAPSPGKEDFEKERACLHSKIGELTVVVDFLEKKSKQLGL